MTTDEIVKQINKTEESMNKILSLIKREQRDLSIREERFELRRHKFCEAEMSQDLEYDILKLREEVEEFREIKRETIAEIEKRHEEFIDTVLKVFIEIEV